MTYRRDEVSSRQLGKRVAFGLCAVANLASCPLFTDAKAQSVGPLFAIAPPLSPLSACMVDRPREQQAQFADSLYRNTMIEPAAAIAPPDPGELLSDAGELLIVYMQDIWSDGGARGVVGSLSIDRGRNWTVFVPSGDSACTGGSYPRSADTRAAVGWDGTIFVSSLSFKKGDTSAPFGVSAGAVSVSRSRDRGKTWDRPATLIEDDTQFVFSDRPSIATDPSDAGIAYVVWDRLSFVGSGSASTATIGPTYFSRSVDNGVTWSSAAPIYEPGLNSQTYNNLILVTRSGKVVDFFTLVDAAGNADIAFIASIDRGASWSAPGIVTAIQVPAVVTPDAQTAVRSEQYAFSVANDAAEGAIYLVWEDSRFDSALLSGIAFAQSLDGGATWSAPVRINGTPQDVAYPRRAQAFLPTVAVAGDGTIAVTYYDFRNDVASVSEELTDYFAIFCQPHRADCSKAANWGREVRLTPDSFNLLDAPTDAGLFLGDYMSLLAKGRHIWPVFGLATAQNRTAVMVRTITLP